MVKKKKHKKFFKTFSSSYKHVTPWSYCLFYDLTSDWLHSKGLLAYESWLKHLPLNVLQLLQFVNIHSLRVFSRCPPCRFYMCVHMTWARERERESTCVSVCEGVHSGVFEGKGVRAGAEGISHNPLCIIVIRFPRIAQLSHTAPGTRWFVVWHSLTRGPVC